MSGKVFDAIKKEKIIWRLQGTLNKYHPNLINHLSNEGYDRYIQLKLIYTKLLDYLGDKSISADDYYERVKNDLEKEQSYYKEVKSRENQQISRYRIDIYQKLLDDIPDSVI